VLAAIEALNDRRRFDLGARHITVSTSGVVPGIRRLTALGPQFTLAVSLHAARDPLRDVLVPLNRRWPVAEVVAAARDHAKVTGRRISYEVTMIGGVNDTETDAAAMADLLRGDHAHVNLIPMNPVAHTPWTASPMAVIERFAAVLGASGIETTIRRNRGQEVGAACGQLAAERAGEPSGPAAPVNVSWPRARQPAGGASRSSTARVGTSGGGRRAGSRPASGCGSIQPARSTGARARADRIHLDVMDAHFVPNLTFGAKTIRHLRTRTELPLDAHLMVDEPGRFLDEYLEAGCDSITFHVEIEEEIAPTLRRIRAAGRAAGLAVKPATPLSALEPYRELLDIVLVMTVEPGFGGQSFMREVAAEKLLAARDLLSHKVFGAEVHVDGGVNRETAEFVGGLGVDILVVGSALFVKGRDMGREVRLVRALADEGYQFTLNDGVPPIPRDRMVRFASLPKHLAR
jgi:ribulose-phosphate 3-epimerase